MLLAKSILYDVLVVFSPEHTYVVLSKANTIDFVFSVDDILILLVKDVVSPLKCNVIEETYTFPLFSAFALLNATGAGVTVDITETMLLSSI